MKSKYFFEDKQDLIKEEHELFETHQEAKEYLTERCKHKDVKIVGNILRCKCGSSWGGPQIETLYKLFTKGIQ